MSSSNSSSDCRVFFNWTGLYTILSTYCEGESYFASAEADSSVNNFRCLNQITNRISRERTVLVISWLAASGPMSYPSRANRPRPAASAPIVYAYA